MSTIPTPEEFGRASEYMRNRARNLSSVRDDVKQKFFTSGLHEFYILDEGETEFRAYIFFSAGPDLEQANKAGLVTEIQQYVWHAMERAGRGGPDQITICFEMDSHENVLKNFEGSYFLRLRG